MLYRREFLRITVGLSCLQPDNAPTQDAKRSLPQDLTTPPVDLIQKLLFSFVMKPYFKLTKTKVGSGVRKVPKLCNTNLKEEELWCVTL